MCCFGVSVIYVPASGHHRVRFVGAFLCRTVKRRGFYFFDLDGLALRQLADRQHRMFDRFRRGDRLNLDDFVGLVVTLTGSGIFGVERGNGCLHRYRLQHGTGRRGRLWRKRPHSWLGRTTQHWGRQRTYFRRRCRRLRSWDFHRWRWRNHRRGCLGRLAGLGCGTTLLTASNGRWCRHDQNAAGVSLSRRCASLFRDRFTRCSGLGSNRTTGFLRRRGFDCGGRALLSRWRDFGDHWGTCFTRRRSFDGCSRARRSLGSRARSVCRRSVKLHFFHRGICRGWKLGQIG